MYNYIFDPVGLFEYREAINWYGERSIKAVDNFISEVENKIKDICKTPLRYKNTYKKYRETSLKKFPYSIVYLFNKENSNTG